ncbi:copper homeostasis protein CutC [Pseudoroseicyclus sp. H15]
MIQLEICVDAPESLRAATLADRVELCAALPLGGLTPSPGLLAVARDVGAEAHAMIRARPGGFLHDADDLAAALADIAAMRAGGAAGIVIGACHPGGTLDLVTLARLRDAAGGLPVTLHRVIDCTPDPVEATGQAAELGLTRILTSGGAPSVGEGLPVIAAMVAEASGRIEIMAGGGLRTADIGALQRMGVSAVHASAGSVDVAESGAERIGIGPPRLTRPDRVAALREALAF